mmetsp:Transcript_53891/g.128087  ORF Transcript_53891/g.128087 Transcript_53891/m.128087 type:complete len:244 (-) Transcript_53891:435-1166(-)
MRLSRLSGARPSSASPSTTGRRPEPASDPRGASWYASAGAVGGRRQPCGGATCWTASRPNGSRSTTSGSPGSSSLPPRPAARSTRLVGGTAPNTSAPSKPSTPPCPPGCARPRSRPRAAASASSPPASPSSPRAGLTGTGTLLPASVSASPLPPRRTTGPFRPRLERYRSRSTAPPSTPPPRRASRCPSHTSGRSSRPSRRPGPGCVSQPSASTSTQSVASTALRLWTSSSVSRRASGRLSRP